MTVINTNTQALFTQLSLRETERAQGNAMEQLSSGKRINSSADDAAGLAISQLMTAKIRSLNQSVRNANDAIGMLQTVEGSLIEISEMFQRMRELAVQAANDTYSDTQRGYLNDEYIALKAEINRIGTNTEWNGFSVLTADQGPDGNGTFYYQVGAGADQTISVTIAANGAGITADNLIDGTVGTIDTQANAQTEIAALDTGINTVSDLRATLGATINRLEHAADNVANISMNTEASRSQIEDADYAKASTELAKTQIMTQAATSVLAQANTNVQTVLKLLQG